MRALVKRLAGSGLTVLLSSHDMDEVEEICDNVTIMNRGTVDFHGTIAKLRTMAPDPGHLLATTDDTRALATAAQHPRLQVVRDPEAGLVVTGPKPDVAAYAAAIVRAGIDLLAFNQTQTPLRQSSSCSPTTPRTKPSTDRSS